MTKSTIVKGMATTGAVMLTLVAALTGVGRSVSADGFVRIYGESSSWAFALADSIRPSLAERGLVVDLNPSGSTAARRNFLNGLNQFGLSDLPFQVAPEDGSAPELPAPGSFGYVPSSAGGLAFAYNLVVDGERLTGLRLSGENVARIFTRTITSWNDPAIVADNPGVALPDRAIIPVVRSEESGATEQLTGWMAARHGPIWATYCTRVGRTPCTPTTLFPPVDGMIAQSGDVGVAGYVSQGFADGAIGYVNHTYALASDLPVAKIGNAAGYYTAPTPSNVGVSLLAAVVADDGTVDVTAVRTGIDPRNYEISYVAYLIVPLGIGRGPQVGRSVAELTRAVLCEAQAQAPARGDATLPVGLVRSGLDTAASIAGADVATLGLASCANPAFTSTGEDLLATTSPFPPECDRVGATPCDSAPPPPPPAAVDPLPFEPSGSGDDGDRTATRPPAASPTATPPRFTG